MGAADGQDWNSGRIGKRRGWLAITEEKCDSGWRNLSNENGYHYIKRIFSQSGVDCLVVTAHDRPATRIATLSEEIRSGYAG